MALMAIKEEATATVEKAKSDAGHLALAYFKKSKECVGLLGESNDGGWVAAKRCVCHTHPSLDWEQMEIAFAEGGHLRLLDSEPYKCSKDEIC